MSQTYYNHTSKFQVVKDKLVPASSIAIKREGDTFYYGIAICSTFDNFSRKLGRQFAEMRMNDKFGTLEVPEEMKTWNEKESCLFMLYNLTKSVIIKNRKWKRDITRYNLTGSRKDLALGQIIKMKSSPVLNSDNKQSA